MNPHTHKRTKNPMLLKRHEGASYIREQKKRKLLLNHINNSTLLDWFDPNDGDEDRSRVGIEYSKDNIAIHDEDSFIIQPDKVLESSTDPDFAFQCGWNVPSLNTK